jgi:small subunit ribosomal protein S18
MAQNESEIRYLTPPTVEIKKKKYCRFKKNRIKYIDYRTPNSLRNSLMSRVKYFPAELRVLHLNTRGKWPNLLKEQGILHFSPM